MRPSGANPARAPAALLGARLAALYVLSLSAVTHLPLAWEPARLRSPLSLAWPPVALAAAALGGAALHDRLSLLAERAGRGRLRGVGWIGYSLVLLMAVLGVMAEAEGREAVGIGGTIMRLLQPAFLLLAGMGRGHIGAITNAFGLTCLAALAGGSPAASAAASFTGFLVFFLVVDHHARKFAEYPLEAPPGTGPALARAFLLGGGAAAALAVFFLLQPPGAASGMGRPAAPAPLTREQVLEIYLNLSLAAALFVSGLYLLLRFAVGRGRAAGELRVERVAARRRVEPLAPPAAPAARGTGSGWEGRIVEIYVRLLARLARWGVRRRPSETPSEFAGRLAPAGPAETITAIFCRARYGAGGVTEADFREASRAGNHILGHFRGRR